MAPSHREATGCVDSAIYYYYYYYYRTVVHIKCIQQKHTCAYANSAVYSSYIISQSCNVQLIQMKATRKVQVIVSQLQQFRHKTNSSAFTNREFTFIISCDKTLRKTLAQCCIGAAVDLLATLSTLYVCLVISTPAPCQ